MKSGLFKKLFIKGLAKLIDMDQTGSVKEKLRIVSWGEHDHSSLGAAQMLPPALGPNNHREHRVKLAHAMKNGDVWLLGAKEDEDTRFLQDLDFWWLSGVTTPNAAIQLIIKNGCVVKETLYLQPKNIKNERWNGPRLGPDDKDAKVLTGFKDVAVLDKGVEKAAKQNFIANTRFYEESGRSSLRYILAELAPLHPRPYPGYKITR